MVQALQAPVHTAGAPPIIELRMRSEYALQIRGSREVRWACLQAGSLHLRAQEPSSCDAMNQLSPAVRTRPPSSQEATTRSRLAIRVRLRTKTATLAPRCVEAPPKRHRRIVLNVLLAEAKQAVNEKAA
eukprot:6206422-Pleurochrysis_carterae.AAC.2